MPSPKLILTELAEYTEENVKTLTSEMPWMRDRTFKCCETVEELKTFVDGALSAGRCALDLETTGLNSRLRKDGTPIEKIVGAGLCFNSKHGIYIPINHQEDPETNLPQGDVLHELNRLCSNPSCTTIYHNAKFDLAFLRNHGVTLPEYNRFEDTLILARLYDAGQKDIKLKHLSERLLGQKMIEFNEIAKNKRFDFVSPRIGYVYGCSDAVCTFDLFHYFNEQPIVQRQRSIYNIEKRVVLVVMQMEFNMVKIDTKFLETKKAEMETKVAQIQKEIYALAKKEFNIGSTQQLGKILFDELKYPYPIKEMTASKQYSTDTATLEKIKDQCPVVAKIIEYRECEKFLGTYINNLLRNHDEDNCIKLGFNQSGTDTGRFSSPGGDGIDTDGYSGVNVQALPKGEIRKAFVARPGYKIVAMDFSNEEMRVAANLSKEPVWVEAFLNGEDLHMKSGQIIYGRQEITKEERGVGKTVNFGTLYGAGPRRIAEVAHCSETEAKRIQAAFFAGLPYLKKWIDTEIRKARKSKTVSTAFQRERPLNIYYESDDRGMQSHGDRCVCNTEIQGSCADIMKYVMVRVHNFIYGYGLQDEIHMLLTMHDEIVYEIREDKLDLYIPKLNQIMCMSDVLQDILHWPVPLTMDAEYGDNWYVDHDYFKEHPEARTAAPVEFQRREQVGGHRFAIALGNPSMNPPVGDPKGTDPNSEGLQGTPGTVGMPTAPADAMQIVDPASGAPADSEGSTASDDGSTEDFVYTIKKLDSSTVRLFNMAIVFLTEEAKNAYQGPKKTLILKDLEGNSLLVSDIKISTDGFLSLARFMGL